jgi:hypothetical protein
MFQDRHLALRIDRHEPGLVLLEPVQVDVAALEREALLLQRDQAFEGIRARFGVIELE